MCVCVCVGGFAWGQRRAEHFMKLIGLSLSAVLQRHCTKDLWQKHYRQASLLAFTTGSLCLTSCESDHLTLSGCLQHCQTC